MNALKIAVVGLLVVVAGLLFTIRRMANQKAEQPIAQNVAPAAPAAEPAPPVAPAVPATAPEQQKPSPVAPRKPLTKPRQPAPQASAAAPRSEKPAETPAAPTAPPAAAEPPAGKAPETPAPPPAPRHVTIPAGTTLVVRTQNTISTDRNFRGDTFSATLEEPLTIDGFVVAERGSTVDGHVVRSEKAGRVEGVSDLAVELVRLHTSDGQTISIATNLHEVHGKQSRGSDAKKVGVATGVGAIIGAIAGGGNGAAIGAGVGAGAGTGAVLATRGEPATLSSETRLTFHVRAPVELTERR